MANKAISELPQAQNVNNQDLFVLEQSGIAKKLTAETFITEQGIIDALAEALDGHGGIQSVTLSSVSGRIRTYRITFTDQSATTFQVYDGTSIDRISRTSSSGLDDVYTIFLSDGTTTFFTVHNGADGTVSEAMLNDALKNKAPAVTETTESSAIATFTDGADDMPLHNILAEINPVQDLNGYDSPWPAGGGKNKFDVEALPTGTDQGVFKLPDGSIKVVAPSSSGGVAPYKGGYMKLSDVAPTLAVGQTYTLSFISTGTQKHVYLATSQFVWANGSARTITQNDLDSIIFFYASGAGTEAIITNFQIELGSTPTAWTPYSNICPITGWTGCNVTRTGRNVYDISKINRQTYMGVTVERVEDRLHVYGTATTSSGFAFGDFHLMPGSYVYSSTSENLPMYLLKGYAQIGGTIPTMFDVSSASDTYRFRLQLVNGTTYDFYVSNVQIELGSTATVYEPYQSTTLAVDWTTEAGTVYVGTIDVATGLLTVEYVKQTITSFTGVFGAVTNGYCAYAVVNSTTRVPSDVDPTFMKSNVFTYTSATRYDAALYTYGGNAGGPTTYSFILPSSVTSLADANAWLADNPTECTCKLATPQTYQLTGQQLKTLLGTNNVWADTGNVSVTYPADTKMFIEKLTMPTEDDLVANQAITSGKYFMVGNSLYLALANIASGAQITIGTNAQRVSLADALNTINS